MEPTVSDCFDVKGRTAIDYGATGVVVVFAAPGAQEPPEQDRHLLVIRPDGWMVRAEMFEVKRHGPGGFGVFLRGLSTGDVPVGSRVRWGKEFWPDEAADKPGAPPFAQV